MSPDAFYRITGTVLRAARQKRGWTVYDVAAVVGVSGVTVSRWERAVHRMQAHHYLALMEEGLL